MLSRRGASGRPIKKCPHAAHPCECDMSKERYIFVMLRLENGEYTCKPQYRGQAADRCTLEGGRDVPLWPGAQEDDFKQPAKPSKKAKLAHPGDTTELTAPNGRGPRFEGGGEQRAGNKLSTAEAKDHEPLDYNDTSSESTILDDGSRGEQGGLSTPGRDNVAHEAAPVDQYANMHKASNGNALLYQAESSSGCCRNSTHNQLLHSTMKERIVPRGRKRQRNDEDVQQQHQFQRPNVYPDLTSNVDLHQPSFPQQYDSLKGYTHKTETSPADLPGFPSIRNTLLATAPPSSTCCKSRVPDAQSRPTSQLSQTPSPNPSSGNPGHVINRIPDHDHRAETIQTACQLRVDSNVHQDEDQSSSLYQRGCQCGPACNCPFCAKHWDNASTREAVHQISVHFDQQSFSPWETPNPSRDGTGQEIARPPTEIAYQAGFRTAAAFTHTESNLGYMRSAQQPQHLVMPWQNQSHVPLQVPPAQIPQIPYPQLIQNPQNISCSLQSQQLQPKYVNFFAYPTGGCDNATCLCGSNCTCDGCQTHHGHIFRLDGDPFFTPFDHDWTEQQELSFDVHEQIPPALQRDIGWNEEPPPAMNAQVHPPVQTHANWSEEPPPIINEHAHSVERLDAPPPSEDTEPYPPEPVFVNSVAHPATFQCGRSELLSTTNSENLRLGMSDYGNLTALAATP